MKKILLSVLLFFLLIAPAGSTLFSQEIYTRADTLKGSITPERAWWNVLHYDLKVTVNPETQSISGSNTILYQVLQPHQVMQIDLQKPMKIERIVQDGRDISFTSEGNAHFLKLEKKQIEGKNNSIEIYFSGKPKIARKPPWDGGMTWTKDNVGNHWIANANQGIGASVWWPLKDHPTEEPDNGMKISVTTPKDLMDVSNGQLKKVIENPDDTKTWVWEVVNPINAYGVNISIGNYIHFSEEYEGEGGTLKMDYYVLPEYEEQAREQFKQAPMMIEAFEHWYGPYPFYEDGYKLIQVPYLGMEHQSSVTYGNGFTNGYLGADLSGSGWGMKFDFILIHESAHEWFANSITNHDVADMWVHEGFTCYSENIYLDYHFGKKASSEYVIGLRDKILNDKPIIGTYGIDTRGSSDIYYKGANILHTVRQMVDNDKKWRKILRGLHDTFKHQIVTSDQVEKYICKHSSLGLSKFWDQYLRTTRIPKLEYRINGKTIDYRFVDIIEGFDMPLILEINGKEKWVIAGSEWKQTRASKPVESFQVKKDFYVLSEEKHD